MKSLKHDVVALTELHGRQLDAQKSKLWITSPTTKPTPNGKSVDPARCCDPAIYEGGAKVVWKCP